MAEDQSLPTIFSEAISRERQAVASRVAEHMRPVYGHEPVKPDERRRRFWQTAPGWTVEHEYRLLTGMNPDGTPVIDNETGQLANPMSPRAVGLLKYPNREIDAKAGGRADDLAAITKYMREMAEMGPPDPEPLEAMAQQQGGQDADTIRGGRAVDGLGTGPLLGTATPEAPPAVPMAPPAAVAPPMVPDPLMGG